MNSKNRSHSLWDVLEESPLFNWILLIVDFIIVGGIGGSLLAAWHIIQIGALDQLGAVAQFAGALATVGLLRVTFSYVRSTQELVDETRKSREDDRQQRKQEKQEELRSLRIALKAELESMGFFDYWSIEAGKGVPTHDTVSTTVYESNSPNLGTLSQSEIKPVVEFYSLMAIVQDMFKRHGDISVEMDASLIGTDTQKKNRVSAIRRHIERLSILRQHALLAIDRQLVESGEESVDFDLSMNEGQVLSAEHPIVHRNPHALHKYGLLEAVTDGDLVFRVTEVGEEFFSGEVDVRELEPQWEDKDWTEKWLGKMNTIQKKLSDVYKTSE
ncbi:hypothetical protein ACFQH6_19535 [Halobacteriaceae archaeon GCM10025711]